MIPGLGGAAGIAELRKFYQNPPSPEQVCEAILIPQKQEVFTEEDVMLLMLHLSTNEGDPFSEGFYASFAESVACLLSNQTHISKYKQHSAKSWCKYAMENLLSKEIVNNENAPCTPVQIQNDKTFALYMKEINSLKREFSCWDSDDILTALFMSSGYIHLARSVLNVGFRLEKLPETRQAEIFTTEEDAIINQKKKGPMKQLIAQKGQENVDARKIFLQEKASLTTP